MVRRAVDRPVRLQHKLIHKAPSPILSRFVRFDDGMLRGVEVPGRMRIFGRITAPDMPAGHTKTEMDPGISDFQAILTSISAWSHFSDLIGVLAAGHF
jgi:hypothetical protein